jgi:uncharacterized protein YceK
MMKYVTGTLLFFMATLSLLVSGCGSVDSPTSSSAAESSQSTVYGVASLETSTEGTVSVKDSSATPQEITVAISSDGSYTADVTGLAAPFILKASGTGQASENNVLYSVSVDGGCANINQLSDTAVAAAAEDQNAEQDILYSRFNHYENHRTANKFEEVINSLRTVLAPLFDLYQITGNPITEDEHEHHEQENSNSGLRALLRDVSFNVSHGTVTVKNRATGGIIFSGPLNDLASGTFYPENMPAGPDGATACTYTYSDWDVCQSDNTQTRTLLTTTPSGCTGTPVLSQACTYVPPTSSSCTYNYSDWGSCQSDNTQSRTVLQATPEGCTGTPLLSQSCTYAAPTCTYTYNAWGACQSDNTQSRTVASSSPAGCTGTPVLTQACSYAAPTCTSFTYSGWGTCTNGTQTRTITTSSPSGCTGGTPAALTQSCTTTCTSFTYSAWGTCTNGTQTRTITTSSPSGCTGGTPAALSQSCTSSSTVTKADVTASCTGCHGLTVNTTVFKSGGYTVTGRSASNWLTSVNSMVKKGATLASGTTAQDYADYLAALP